MLAGKAREKCQIDPILPIYRAPIQSKKHWHCRTERAKGNLKSSLGPQNREGDLPNKYSESFKGEQGLEQDEAQNRSRFQNKQISEQEAQEEADAKTRGTRRNIGQKHGFLGNIPVTTSTKIFPKVLRYKWEAYCNTNGRRTAIQMGGVLRVFPFLKA